MNIARAHIGRFAAVLLLGLAEILGVAAGAAVIHVPADKPTLLAAVTDAQDGDVILISDGIYTGPGNEIIQFDTKALSVTSESMNAARCMFPGGIMMFSQPASGYAHLNAVTVNSVECMFFATTRVTHCRILGGHVLVTGSAVPYFNHCEITGCNPAPGAAAVEVAIHGYSTFINCLIHQNAGRGVYVADSSGPRFINCTIAGNSGPGAVSEEWSVPEFENCVIWGNDGGGIIVDYGSFANAEVSFSCVQGGWSGIGNIAADPEFTMGPAGGYYLASVSAGQGSDSPCLNTGSALAGSICYQSWDGDVCLDELTTRTDTVTDTGTVDMGYHHDPHATAPPTPTPTFTPTPESSPTPECDILGSQPVVPAAVVHPGEQFYCDAEVCNPGPGSHTGVPFLALLDVYSRFYILLQTSIDLDPGRTRVTIVPPFTWPAGAGSGQAAIYAAMTDENITELFGELGFVVFSWVP